MKLLLDTHTLLWSTVEPEHLSSTAAALIADAANMICVSAASAWEISTKVRLGMLPGAEHLERDFLGYMETSGHTLLSIDTEVALRAGRLPGNHRDPFDRMIAAQALAMDIPVLSVDAELDGFGVRRIW